MKIEKAFSKNKNYRSIIQIHTLKVVESLYPIIPKLVGYKRTGTHANFASQRDAFVSPQRGCHRFRNFRLHSAS